MKKLKREGKPIPQLFLCCGTEDFLIEPNRDFHRFLLSEGVPHEYLEAPGVHEVLERNHREYHRLDDEIKKMK